VSDTPPRARDVPDLFIPGLRRLYAVTEELAYPLIRFAAGALLVPHGAQKLFGWFGGDPARLAGVFEQIGLFPGSRWVAVTGMIEFFGGALVAVGLLTRPAALACTALLLVAVMVQAPFGWFWTNRGVEFALLWAVLCLAIAMRGGGGLSLDRAIGKEL